jgi:hypothetical protein
MSSKYEGRDEACPVSTGGKGERAGARRADRDLLELPRGARLVAAAEGKKRVAGASAVPAL